MANKVKGADLNVPAEKLKSIEAGALRRGAAKYADVDGAADFPKKDTKQHMASVKHAKDGMHLGAKRMGYSQSFGASRMNSYARGAAKVMDIMNFGAANAGHGGVAGHSHPSMTTKKRVCELFGYLTACKSTQGAASVGVSKNTGGRHGVNICGFAFGGAWVWGVARV